MNFMTAKNLGPNFTIDHFNIEIIPERTLHRETWKRICFYGSGLKAKIMVKKNFKEARKSIFKSLSRRH